jgi:phosphotransferase system IIA component
MNRQKKLVILVLRSVSIFLNLFKDSGYHKILSPFDGNIVPSDMIAESNISRDVFGNSLGIQPVENEVLSPCACIVERISPVGNAMLLKVGNAHLIINVGLEFEKYKKEFFKLNVVEGQRISKGQKLMSFDIEKIYKVDTNFVCTITVKQNRTSRHVSFINAKHVSFDTILCTLNVL